MADNVVRGPQQKAWLPDDARGVRISMGADVLVLIQPDGNIRLKPGTTLDEAAMAFWQAINEHHPFKDDYLRLLGMLRGTSKENRRLMGLLEENGIDYRTGGPKAAVSVAAPARNADHPTGVPEAARGPGSVPG
jgi:hypothetical protein